MKQSNKIQDNNYYAQYYATSWTFYLSQLQINIFILFYMGSSSTTPVDYSQEIAGSKKPGFSSIYRKKGITQLLRSPEKEINNIRDILRLVKSRYGTKTGLAEILVQKSKGKEGEDIEERSIIEHTYNEAYDTSYQLGKAIYEKHLFHEEKERNMKLIGIYSKNSYEWYMTDWACINFGITTVPLYDTLGVANLTYCLKQTEITSLFVTAATLKTLLTLQDFGNLKTIISYDKVDEQTAAKVHKMKFQLVQFNQLVKQGANSKVSNDKINIGYDDIYTFSYTSGTTGPPKGTLISHGNIVSCIGSFETHQDVKLTSEDRYLSYLPLPHIMERVLANYNFYKGVYVVVSTGNMLKLKDDCFLARPSIFISVPRIFNKIVQAVKAKFAAQSGCKKMLIDSAVNSKIDQIQKNGEYQHCFYDSLIFSKVKEGFGGNIRMMASASAPLNHEVQKFMNIIMACPLIQAYGQTENTGGCLFGRSLEKHGFMCEIAPGLQIKLANIPQMKYLVDDKDQVTGKPLPRGELWIRGPQICKGYYKLPDITKETINSEGWLQTGDVVQIMDEGRAFKIIDRKKNIFKLQQGEYIAPDKVENIYLKSNLISQVFLHGDSTQNFAVAIITPNKDNLMKLVESKNIKGTYESVCALKQVRILVLKELNLIGRAKQSGLHGFQLAKNIHLEANGFAPRNILTNTMKLVRFDAKKSFASEIQKMYKEGELSDK